MDDETGLVAPLTFVPSRFILMMQAWIEKKFQATQMAGFQCGEVPSSSRRGEGNHSSWSR
jgi:hypothetical protein